jgi:anti-anti-sigma factor
MGELIYPLNRVELDGFEIPALRAELFALVNTTDDETLVLDCEGLTFLDSSAIEAFVHTRLMLDRHGRSLGVVNLTGFARKVCELLGLDDLGIIDLDQRVMVEASD